MKKLLLIILFGLASIIPSFGQSLDSLWSGFADQLHCSNFTSILRVETFSSDASSPVDVYLFEYQVKNGNTQVDYEDRGLRLVSDENYSVLIDQINKSVTVRPISSADLSSIAPQMPIFDRNSILNMKRSNSSLPSQRHVTFKGVAPAKLFAPVESEIEVSFDLESGMWLHTLIKSPRKDSGFDAVKYSWLEQEDSANPITLSKVLSYQKDGSLSLTSSFSDFDLRLQKVGG